MKRINEKPLFSKRELLLLVIPLIIEQALAGLMGMADTFMVSGLGEAAISGVSCVDMLNLLLLFVFEAIGIGGNILCAQYIGGKNPKAANEIAKQLMAMVLAVSVLLTIPFLLYTERILRLIYSSAKTDVIGYAVQYLWITALSYPFLALYTASTALYRATGNSKFPVSIIAAGNLLNVAGNAVGIYVLKIGVIGAAGATSLSRVLCCVVILRDQFKTDSCISLLGLKEYKPDLYAIKRIIRVGLPGAVDNGMFQLGKVIVQSTVVTLGTTAIAAHAIVIQIETLALRPSLAIGTALLTVAGQYTGAGRVEEARKNSAHFTIYSQCFCTALSIIAVLLTPALCRLAGLDASGSKLVFELMIFISVSRAFTWAIAFTLPNGLRAAGDVSYVMCISVMSMWVFRVLLSCLLCRFTSAGLWGIWIGWISDWAVRAIIFYCRFRNGKWMDRKLI